MMKTSIRSRTALSALSVLFLADDALADNSERGKMLYDTLCVACHSIDYNGVGPAHRGVFGRKAGARANYDYSPALKNSNITWTTKTLDLWLAGPEKLVPGQKMGFSVESDQDRADLIAYLKTLSASAP